MTTASDSSKSKPVKQNFCSNQCDISTGLWYSPRRSLGPPFIYALHLSTLVFPNTAFIYSNDNIFYQMSSILEIKPECTERFSGYTKIYHHISPCQKRFGWQPPSIPQRKQIVLLNNSSWSLSLLNSSWTKIQWQCSIKTCSWDLRSCWPYSGRISSPVSCYTSCY